MPLKQAATPGMHRACDCAHHAQAGLDSVWRWPAQRQHKLPDASFLRSRFSQ
jgi:hypothetical protein